MTKAQLPETLILDSIQYLEMPGEPGEWNLEKTTLGVSNLIVGKNASGKSRLISVISSLSKLISGRIPKAFPTGKYDVQFHSLNGEKYSYFLEMSQGKVVKELLKVGRFVRLNRKGENGKIWAKQLRKNIAFNAPPDQLAVRLRRDSIQHSFFDPLHNWAESLRHYQFGTPLGRDKIMLLSNANDYKLDAEEVRDEFEVTKLYSRAFGQFGSKFDKAILRDMNLLGYPCTSVNATQMPIPQIQGALPIGLSVKEVDLPGETTQLTMSQGMFRALALVINLNYCLLSKRPRMILIDDIGEGLDFSRAKSFIRLILDASHKHNLQLVMTTNDRFVMNGIPLEFWGIISRSGNTVKVLNIKNSKKAFSEFNDLGLNNFDFFEKNLYVELS